MEIVSSIVKDQLNRFIIEMGDFAMKKKTIIISGIAAVLVIGSVVFCFAVKGDSTQPADVAQTVTEAVATPTIEIPEETSEEVSEPEEAEEVPEVEVQETTEEVSSIVEVVETSPEVSEDAGVSTQKEEVSSEQSVEPKQEEVKPAETKPVETQPVQTQPQQTQSEPNVNQISTDQAVAEALARLDALGAEDGIPHSTSTAHGFESSGGAAAQIIVE